MTYDELISQAAWLLSLPVRDRSILSERFSKHLKSLGHDDQYVEPLVVPPGTGMPATKTSTVVIHWMKSITAADHEAIAMLASLHATVRPPFATA